MPNIPIPDYDDPKEIYAFFGLAVYGANLVESSLINLATVLQLDRVNAITRHVFDSVFQNMEAKTLGQLLTATRSLTTVPPEVDAVLAEALKKRNYLIHAFFRNHAGTILHDAGNREMIEELRSMILLFQKADDLITPIYLALWKRFGVDEAAIERELKQVELEITSKYSGL